MRGVAARVVSVGTGLFLCAGACNQIWGIEEPHDRADGGPSSNTGLSQAIDAAPSRADAFSATEGGGSTVVTPRPDAPLTDPGEEDAAVDAPPPPPPPPPCEGGPVVCTPGTVDPGKEPCGDCNLGTKSHTRTCLPDGCGWSAWSGWSDCTGSTAECPAGTVEPNPQPCGWCNSGTQTQTRTCGSDCKWGGWSGFGACENMTAECQPNTYKCCGAGNWEWCYVNTCKWTRGCASCNGNCGC
jgi:hypothetical protein